METRKEGGGGAGRELRNSYPPGTFSPLFRFFLLISENIDVDYYHIYCTFPPQFLKSLFSAFK